LILLKAFHRLEVVAAPGNGLLAELVRLVAKRPDLCHPHAVRKA
jgi:hypothetical protein